ncbi:MAG: hypothetical protein KF883_00220 [Thermomicrobiales bacterium]|nr:hypothetical protein [Thermomicrobiales bacterium]
MDCERFDRLTRLLGEGASRRSVLRSLLGFGGAVVAVPATESVAGARTSRGRPTIPPPDLPDCLLPDQMCGGVCCGAGLCKENHCCDSASAVWCGNACCENGLCTTTGACCDDGALVCGTLCCAPTASCGRSGNADICCDPANGQAPCGLDCCASESQCCGRECCPPDALCLARVFGGYPEELCCPESLTCDGQCCTGTCFSPIGESRTGPNRVCCPPALLFCPDLNDPTQGSCCEKCCHDDTGLPLCAGSSQCCPGDCDGLADPSQCLEGVCIDGTCAQQPICANGEHCCAEGGSHCCPEGQECCGEECCATGTHCCGDGRCCPDGQQCCDDGCCEAGAFCCESGDRHCCAGEQECCGDQCCDPGRECCGSACCETGESCCERTVDGATVFVCIPEEATCCSTDDECAALSQCAPTTQGRFWHEISTCGAGGYCIVEEGNSTLCESSGPCQAATCDVTAGCGTAIVPNYTVVSGGVCCNNGEFISGGNCCAGQLCPAPDYCTYEVLCNNNRCPTSPCVPGNQPCDYAFCSYEGTCVFGNNCPGGVGQRGQNQACDYNCQCATSPGNPRFCLKSFGDPYGYCLSFGGPGNPQPLCPPPPTPT